MRSESLLLVNRRLSDVTTDEIKVVKSAHFLFHSGLMVFYYPSAC